MNFYTKINKYFLERMPTIWNTHFVWMILICVLTHILFFAIGFATIDVEELKQYGIRNKFFNGTYFSFYCIIGILALIFFGFRYFTHNPFKHFYPISKTYFWKILGQLFIIFFLYGAVFISFENGMKLKCKKITTVIILQNEANQIAIAKPFLYNQLSDYFIDNRSHPQPFPFDDIENLTIGYDSINNIDIKHEIDYKKPYLELNTRYHQFGKIKIKQLDSCNSKEILDSIYDVSKMYGLEEYSLYNYGNLKVGDIRKYDNQQNFGDNEIELTTIHQWQLKRDSVAIANCIQNVKNICKKYNINEQLLPMKMAVAGLNQNLNKKQLIRTGFVDYKKYIKGQNENGSSDEPEISVDGDNTSNTTPPQIDFNYFADLPEFNTLYDNVESLKDEMGTMQLKNWAMWALIFGSLAFALFFVLIKYVALKDLIIGIFVAGILLSILAIFITVITKLENDNREILTIGFAVLYAVLIMVAGLCCIYSSKIKKSIATKGFISFCIATIAFFPALLFYIRQNSYSMVVRLCDTYPDKVYAFDLAAWHFVLLGLVSIAIIFTTLRKVYSKLE